MRQLLTMRHAKSSWDDPSQPDHARPLNARGRAAAAAMRLEMRSLGFAPDLVLVSSARRTLQTLEALGPWNKPPRIEPQDALYLASLEQLLEVLQAVPEDVGSVLLLGHNPGLHDLALRLGGTADSEGGNAAEIGKLNMGYPTGALAEFAVPGPWSELRRARLLRFFGPRDLPGQPH